MKTNKIFLILFFSLIILLFLNVDAYAANATIALDKANVEVGKTVKITVSGTGVQWNLKLKVDGEVLKTSSEFENYESNKNISFSVSYTPKTAGTKNVTLEGSVTEFSDGSTVKSFEPKIITVAEKQENNGGSTNNGGTNTGTNNGTTNNNSGGNNSTANNNSGTTAEQPKTKSTNAYLSTLGVTPKEYDFSGFKKSNLNYSVTVPYEVDSLKVLYKTAHSGATVKVTGNSGFEVGSNNKINSINDYIDEFVEDHIDDIENALTCGVKVIASIHASSVSDLKNKKLFQEVLGKSLFKRYIFLSHENGVGTLEGVFNENKKPIYMPFD